MKSETLNLSGTLDEAGAMAVARALNATNGVSKVTITTTTATVHVTFDDKLTALQELRAVLRKSGFETKSPLHGEAGMCCGSCGG